MKRPWLAVPLLLLACSPATMPGASSQPITPPPPPVLLLAGTARADVTPPPGASTFGMGPDARVAEGLWTRLYCRAFVLETTPGRPLAVVPCDLAAMSTLLQRSVALRIRDILPASRLMMTATHTHAGPAHYFDGRYYGDMMSTYLPGFDPKMVDFLADRIAEAVRQAYDHRAPATLRWGHDPNGMWGLTRNRALGAYRRNNDPAAWPVPDAYRSLPPEQLAVDPNLDVLRIDEVDAAGKPCGPLGVVSFLAMHPTVMPIDNPLFDADTHGILSRVIEHDLRAEGSTCPRAGERDPLHAVVNGNEGDIAPDWRQGTQAETVRIGRAIAERVRTVLGHLGPAIRRPALDLRYYEEDIPNAAIDDPPQRVCNEPAVGEEFARGACDHRCSFNPFWLSAISIKHVDCQGKKQVVFGHLQALAMGKYAFPSRLPLALARIDDTLVSFVPAELTITAGKHLRDAVSEASGDPALHSIIAGLANSYILYVTTHEEYAADKYEGAATLYGRYTAEFLKERYALLERSMRGEHIPTLSPRLGVATPFYYETGSVRARLPVPDDAPSIPELGDDRRPLGLCKHSRPSSPPAFCFQWFDAGPGQVAVKEEPWVVLVHAGDRTPVALASGDLVDDRGWAFTTRMHERRGRGVAWSTSFEPADSWAELAGGRPVRIRTRDVRGYPPIESVPMAGSAVTAECDADAMARCFPEEGNLHIRDLEAERQCAAVTIKP